MTGPSKPAGSPLSVPPAPSDAATHTDSRGRHPERPHPPRRAEFARTARAVFRRKLAAASVIVVLLMACACFLGPLLYHTDQVHAQLASADLPPGSPGHPLGTDDVGFDELGRLMLGGQLSLEVGLCAAVFATAFGAIWGAVAGYFTGPADAFMMRIVDALSSMPSLFILIFISHLFSLNLPVLILLISYVAWLSPARLIRGEVLTLKAREFVQAGHTMGGGARHAISRHLLPNTLGTMLVNASFQVADAILFVAALGYLGISLPPPNDDWGSMLSNGTDFIQAGYWWMAAFPAAAIVLVVLAFNIIGDALSDELTARAS